MFATAAIRKFSLVVRKSTDYSTEEPSGNKPKAAEKGHCSAPENSRFEILTQARIEPTNEQLSRDDSGDRVIEKYSERPRKVVVRLERYIMDDSTLEHTGGGAFTSESRDCQRGHQDVLEQQNVDFEFLKNMTDNDPEFSDAAFRKYEAAQMVEQVSSV